MQVFNIDETGISIVHKPSKVICEVGRKRIYSITSAEKGIHIVVLCFCKWSSPATLDDISPQKAVPEKLKVGSLPGTIFRNGSPKTYILIGLRMYTSSKTSATY